jgi:Peptidase propeptide and YPEB domain
MRRTLNIGIAVGTAAIIGTMAAGVASAATGGHQQAAGSAAAVSSVNRHITRTQARQIAMAKVPHSRVIEIHSDDRHDRAVWEVELAAPRGRVVVDVDKRTGNAVIVRHGGGGHDDAIAASPIASVSFASPAGDDHGRDAFGDDRGRDARDHDGAREERGDRDDHGNRNDRGDRHGDHRGDRHGDGHDGDQDGDG